MHLHFHPQAQVVYVTRAALLQTPFPWKSSTARVWIPPSQEQTSYRFEHEPCQCLTFKSPTSNFLTLFGAKAWVIKCPY